MIREKLEMRRKKYASRKRIKLITAGFAILMTFSIIHRAAVPKTDAIFRYNNNKSDKLTVTTDVYKIYSNGIFIEQYNLSATDDVYGKAD